MLTIALKARVTEIRECNIIDNDAENKIYNMIIKLSSDYGLDEKSAAWVTFAWSIGFDLMTAEEFDDLANGNSGDRYLILGIYIANIDKNIQQREISSCNPISNTMMVNTTNLKQLYENGIMLHNQGKFAEALECYDKALAIDPQDEFIIKRMENTKEILFNSSSIKTSGQVISQVSNLNNGLKKSFSLYYLVIAIAAVLLTTGIVTYIIFGTNGDLKLSLLGDKSRSNSDDSTSNIHPTNDRSGSLDSSADKESISDFTNNIEKELNLQINRENQSLLRNDNEFGSDSNSLNLQSNDIGSNSLNGANQKVDNFKTELDRAMKSTFN